MRRLILLCFVLTGCGSNGSAALEACEASLLAQLKAPSSYERISYDELRMTHLEPEQYWVTIEYDAVNSFNAPLRDTHYCKYSVRDGEANFSEELPDTVNVEADSMAP